jgi:hypothetical protein
MNEAGRQAGRQAAAGRQNMRFSTLTSCQTEHKIVVGQAKKFIALSNFNVPLKLAF